MNVSPADMVLFAAVVREGGFTGGARALGLTKQTVSERLARLEAHLGVRLLERTTRRIRPTEAGAPYAERCAAIAAEIDEANREVQRQQAEPVGVLRVSAPVLYGRRFLAPVASAFLRAHPQVRLELLLSDRRVDLVEEAVDLAIRVGALEDSSLTARKLSDGHVYYLASPRFLKQQGALTPASLRTARCVGMQAQETWVVGAVKTKIAPVLVVNDLEVACEAAIAGVGVARLPSLVCREAVRDGRLQVLFGAAAQPRPVYAVYPSRQYQPAKVRHFLDAMAALVEPMEPLPLRRQSTPENVLGAGPISKRKVRRPSSRQSSVSTRTR